MTLKNKLILCLLLFFCFSLLIVICFLKERMIPDEFLIAALILLISYIGYMYFQYIPKWKSPIVLNKKGPSASMSFKSSNNTFGYNTQHNQSLQFNNPVSAQIYRNDNFGGNYRRTAEWNQNETHPEIPANRRLEFETERTIEKGSIFQNRTLPISGNFSSSTNPLLKSNPNKSVEVQHNRGRVNLKMARVPMQDHSARELRPERGRSSEAFGKMTPSRMNQSQGVIPDSQHQRRNYSVDQNLPEKISLKNEKYRNDADLTLHKLEIKNKINTWLENCKKWFMNNLLRRIVQENIENIRNLEQMMTIHYNRRLIEYDFVQEFTNTYQREYKGENNLISTNIDDLVTYVNSENYYWPVTNTPSRESIVEINKKFLALLRERRRLDRYLRPQDFNLSKIRMYALKRLYDIHINNGTFNYENEGEISRNKLPSDVKILANLFFTYLNEYSFESRESDLLIDIVRDRTEKIDNIRLGVCFKQVNPDYFEPHYIIVSENDTWATIPGRYNLFCAITLFFYYVKKNMKGKYLDDPRGELAKDLNMILNL